MYIVSMRVAAPAHCSDAARTSSSVERMLRDSAGLRCDASTMLLSKPPAHLPVRDAGFLEDRSLGDESVLFVEGQGLDLGVEHGLGQSSMNRFVHEHAQDAAAYALPPKFT